jgi:hypothetical protein
MLFINSTINYIYLNQNNIYLLVKKNTCNNKLFFFYNILKTSKQMKALHSLNFLKLLDFDQDIHY